MVFDTTRYFRKLKAFRDGIKNYHDFLLFVFGLRKEDVIIHTLWGDKISLRYESDFINSHNFKLLKALVFLHILEKVGIASRKGDNFFIKKDGIMIEIKQPERYDLFLEALFYLHQKIFFERLEGDVLIVIFEDLLFRVNLSLYPSSLYSFYDVFFERHYACIEYTGKTVFDVGCGVGDSIIFFIKNGAEKVLGFDINEAFIQEAYNNVKLNGFEKRVKIFAREVGLDDIRNREEHIVLKLDCEGCEFSVFLTFFGHNGI